MSQPNESSISNSQINHLLQRRELGKAKKLIEERLKTNNEDADAFYFQGVLDYFGGSLKSSIENLKKCLEFEPKHTDASICLSVLYNDLGKYHHGSQVFEQANQSVSHRRRNDSEIDRKFSAKHLEIADLYARYRRYDEAIEEYSKAISLDPHQAQLKIRRAKAFAKKGFVSRAIQELQQLKAENARDIDTRIQLGLLHFSQGNILDAELEWEQAQAIQPENQDLLNYLEMAKQSR